MLPTQMSLDLKIDKEMNFTAGEMPKTFQNNGYDSDIVDLLTQEAEKYGVPTFDEAVEYLKEQNLISFNFGKITAFFYPTFDDADSSQRFPLVCDYIAETIVVQRYRKDVSENEIRDILMIAANDRINNNYSKQGLAIGILASKTKRFIELAKEVQNQGFSNQFYREES
jgi:hypothetical protein